MAKVKLTQRQEDERVEAFIEKAEEAMTYLEDETRSLGYLQVQLLLEVLKELRTQRLKGGHSPSK